MLFALALAAPLLGAGASYLAYRRSDPAKLRRRAQRGSKRLALAVKRAEKEQEALDEGMAHAARGYSSGFHSARLAGTPITQLKQVGIRGARWSALEDAGIETLADLEGHGPTSLGAIHGVGTSTASGVAAGAAEMTAEDKGFKGSPPGGVGLGGA